MGPPILGAAEALRGLTMAGHTVIIFSMKGDKPHLIQDWMRYYEIPYNHVTRVKPDADVYIDDKAIRFISWTQVLHDISDLTTHLP